MQRKLILIACLMVCAGCFAQQYPFVYYTPKDGLVNSRVRDIWQDHTGRMYFITHGGLSVYDGKRFINYDQRNGLSNDLVNDIIEAAPDSFLVATNAPPLNTLVRGRVGIFKTADNFYPVINRFFKCSNGSWYAAADEGLFKLENNRFVKLRMNDNEGNETGCCLDRILEWKNYFILIPWNHDLKEKMILFDRRSGKIADTELKTQVVTATTNRDGQIWLTTAAGLQMLDTSALNKGKINFLPVPKQYEAINGSKQILALFDSANVGWFYSEGNISIFSPSQEQVIATEQTLRAYTLTDLFIDREGNLWIASDGSGIVKLRSRNIELLSKIDQQTISCHGIAAAGDTIWFFNRRNRSLYRYYENVFTRFPMNEEYSNIYLHQKQIWLGNGETLIRADNKDDPRSYSQAKTILKKDMNVRYGNGLTSAAGTIIQYAVEDGKKYFLYVLKHDRVVMKYPISYAIDQMNFDQQGRIWLTTRDHKLFAFTLHEDQPSKYLQPEKGFPKELPGISPRAVAVDANDDLWIGTRSKGIFKYRRSGDSLKLLTHYTTQHGLTDNFVSFLACDNNNTIWAGTQTGMDRIYQKDSQYIIANISKSNNFFQSVTKIITTNNTVWGITNEAILKITAAGIPSQSTTPPPPLILTSLEVNNRPWHDTSTVFSYQDNNLTFSVAAPSFIDERSVQYSYMLEGGGHSWSTPSNNATFNFVNLSPGHYTLKVRSDFPERIYPSQLLNYHFSITPPWYATWRFRVMVALTALGITALLVRSYIKRKLEKQKHLLERKQAIEKERTRIATDMHDELGAGLSRIKFLSETIGIKKQQQQPVEEDIDKIRMYSHEMIDKMGEIVWALNEKNDSLFDLLAYTRVYAMQYLSENGITCVVNTPAQLPSLSISGELRRNIYLTVKEALHNIVKHAQARRVLIDIETGRSLNISINDDGLGFDMQSIRPYCNGLNNMKRRIESIEGSLQIYNKQGTTVAFTVPLG